MAENIDEKWIKSGLPQIPDAGIDPSTAPFEDNLEEAISARTMRNFAYELRSVFEDRSTASIVEVRESETWPPAVEEAGVLYAQTLG